MNEGQKERKGWGWGIVQQDDDRLNDFIANSSPTRKLNVNTSCMEHQ